jgi:hypothetical protein
MEAQAEQQSLDDITPVSRAFVLTETLGTRRPDKLYPIIARRMVFPGPGISTKQGQTTVGSQAICGLLIDGSIE